MSSELRRAIAKNLRTYAWPNSRLDEATHLVLSYCYRQLPFTATMPRNLDGSRCYILCTASCPSLGLVFALTKSTLTKAREIFILTEDLVLLGTMVPEKAIGGRCTSIAFDPVSKTIFAIAEAGSDVVAFGLDGKRKPQFDLPDRDAINSIQIDGRGNLYVSERPGGGGGGDGGSEYYRITRGPCEYNIPDECVQYIWWALMDGGIVLSMSFDRGPTSRKTVILDSQLKKKSPIVDNIAGSPLCFHAASNTIVVEHKSNCALEAVDFDGTVKFQCPTFFQGDADSFRSPVTVSWGCVLRLFEGDRITIRELIFEPVPSSVLLSR